MRRVGLTWSLVAPQGYSRRDWDRLDRTHLPLLDSEVVNLLLKHLGSGTEVVAVCKKGASIVAMTVIVRYKTVAWQTWQPPQQPLGLWVHDEAIPFSDLMRSFVETQQCAMFSVTHLDPRFYPRPSDIEAFDCMQTTYVPVTTDFKTYWDARHNLRTNLKKQRNKLARAGTATRIEAIRDADMIREAIAAYGRLEIRGWKSGSAIHSANAQGRFYAALFEYLARQGEATVYQYFFGDRLVATDLCVHRNGVVVVLKTTYDETERKMSPALLLKQEMLQQLFQDGRTARIEWYGPVMDWHRHWSEEKTIRAMYGVRQYRWSWLRYAVQQRRRLRSVLGLT